VRANHSLMQHTTPALRCGRATPGRARWPSTRLARVIRDEQRKGGEIAGSLKAKLEIAQRLHAQRRDSKNKLWALHAAEVKCLSGGKARTPYEFGVRAPVAVTAKEGLVVGMRSMPEVLCGAGHKLKIILAHSRVLSQACMGLLAIAAMTLRMPSRLPALRVDAWK
jgi:hypothetical protein